MTDLWDDAKDTASDVYDKVKDIVEKVVDTGKEVAGDIGDYLANKYNNHETEVKIKSKNSQPKKPSNYITGGGYNPSPTGYNGIPKKDNKNTWEAPKAREKPQISKKSLE